MKTTSIENPKKTPPSGAEVNRADGLNWEEHYKAIHRVEAEGKAKVKQDLAVAESELERGQELLEGFRNRLVDALGEDYGTDTDDLIDQVARIFTRKSFKVAPVRLGKTLAVAVCRGGEPLFVLVARDARTLAGDLVVAAADAQRKWGH